MRNAVTQDSATIQLSNWGILTKSRGGSQWFENAFSHSLAQQPPLPSVDHGEHGPQLAVKPIMRQAVFLALSCVLIGCSTLPTDEEHHRDLQAQLRAVLIEDGINEQEANVMAENYFLRFSPMSCGNVERVIDDGTFWIAKTSLGFAQTPTRQPIRIGKGTGRVTWSDGPTIENPKTIW